MEFIVAIVTPFLADGSIGKHVLVRYLEFLHQAGVTTILLQGTTGEYAALERVERRHLIGLVRTCWQGRLLVNISDASDEQALRYAVDAEHCSADGVVLLPPPGHGEYADTVEHFLESVVSRVRLPIYFYNYPKQIGTVLKPHTVRNLMRRFSHIRGLKDSSGSIPSLRAFRDICPSLRLYVGSDMLAPFAQLHGCAGWVSGACGAIPTIAMRMLEAQRQGDETEVQRCFRFIQQWNILLHGDNGGVIAGTKIALSALVRGFEPHCRFPQQPRSDAHRIHDFIGVAM